MALVIALNKGRIFKEVLPVLKECNVVLREDPNDSRRLVFDSVDKFFKIIVVRGADVPAYVENGIADIGITGKDTILECNSSLGFYELLDLQIGICRISVAGLAGEVEPERGLRVATKFPKIARLHYERVGKEISLIKLSGALEIAPLLGLADVIVDIVESGNTLRANGLEEKMKLVDISARLIANRASMKTKYSEIQNLTKGLSQVLGLSS